MLKIVSSKKELTSNKSTLKGYSGYLYGFNGMEKDDEVSGQGNSYTAEFWQYDSRLGRRWNIDPVVKHHESPYAAFANNPIWFADKNGLDTLMMHIKRIDSPKGLVFYVVTFSLIQNGIEKTLSESMYSAANDDSRKIPENKVFKLSFQKMGRHNEWENTIYVHWNYDPDQVGVFYHPGPPNWNNGCQAISCDFPEIKVRKDNFGDKYTHAEFTVEQGEKHALQLIRDIYDLYEPGLTGDKFILKTNSEKKPYIIEKVDLKTTQSIKITGNTTTVLNTDGSSMNYNSSNNNKTQSTIEQCDD